MVTGRDREVECRVTGLFPGNGNDADIVDQIRKAMAERIRTVPTGDQLDTGIAVEHRQNIKQSGKRRDVMNYQQDSALGRSRSPLCCPAADRNVDVSDWIATWHADRLSIRSPGHAS
ncbi:hypothetical protein GCM10009765_84090 [Fodinicola feengrottensis]|uniref:Uncharacterized protein n=1 Tax=Fodinicola feengrottensis TaxID=435914 RepID=A0ABN2JDE0_9ACTN